MNNIILFDGDCHFCDASVQFIIKRDQKAVFSFASLQSETGKQLLAAYELSGNIDSMVLIADGKAHLKSSAALRIAKELSGIWKLAYALIIMPRPVRDLFYDVVARNRYKWFGKKESCAIPSPEVRKRFL
ncbi:thiol-disulfide oxidoreductase DCC family protein [Oceanobacillus indicireducens]|uniref:Thiol-disulfide oxidoreductase DCC family protein n=1 Tax=Oceanobacillus indicireducens TaxID=1004261 RepID=A0A917Y0A6_9BACI|nr:thiol-disulfide oxidoreductase DCC family protein [Oceanobacillus indicireducens]GGN62144.1 hypothetical protein GCM10007971_27800 [Oceanobacillus indicireducens]